MAGKKKARPARVELSPHMESMLDFIKIDQGCHTTPEQGMCVMEALHYITNDGSWDDKYSSDGPVCVSPAITNTLIQANDQLPDEPRQRLKEVIPEITGTHWNDRFTVTKAEERVEEKRQEFVNSKQRELGLAFSRASESDTPAAFDKYVDKVLDVAREAAAMKADEAEITAELRERGIYAGPLKTI